MTLPRGRARGAGQGKAFLAEDALSDPEKADLRGGPMSWPRRVQHPPSLPRLPSLSHALSQARQAGDPTAGAGPVVHRHGLRGRSPADTGSLTVWRPDVKGQGAG